MDEFFETIASELAKRGFNLENERERFSNLFFNECQWQLKEIVKNEVREELYEELNEFNQDIIDEINDEMVFDCKEKLIKDLEDEIQECIG